ncbi:class I SAM-dependent methyltransferase [Alphaproteobacteria bacterium]|nr:class I SAM-dependent methyltransferase [Alphaproteobacteria bacterium]MDC0444591.1 class I SAM-dependent methyltransferase [Alphaproteobacteria bacterium]
MQNCIFETLKSLSLTSIETRELLSTNTRDLMGVKVWKDMVSGVVYIDDFYTGEATYVQGAYRKENLNKLKTGDGSWEATSDLQRRFKSSFDLLVNKKLVEFGCGNGDFLRLAAPHCKKTLGIELQKNYVDALNVDGIECVADLSEVKDDSFDLCASFHVIEHLPDPIKTLKQLKTKIVSGGFLLVEVPNANDFLLSVVEDQNFKDFTLWSQHLLLHTKHSLKKFFDLAGFETVFVKGVQRYPLSNHMNWLRNGKPGGHMSALSIIDNSSLNAAYEASLANIDATDTLFALARKP